jgi:hypothetical protein
MVMTAVYATPIGISAYVDADIFVHDFGLHTFGA